MRQTVSIFALVLLAVLTATGARAQSETDRLRDALRSATAQVRSLEDQRVTLQAKLAEADREKERARRDVDAAKAQIKELEGEYREAVNQFNQRLAERDETLEKWRSAYAEAATVARSKDAERAKFEGEANAFKARTTSCEAKNVKLVGVGRELLTRYRQLTIGDALIASEPMTGLRAVEIQNLLQDFGDKILEQRAKQ